MIYSDKKKFIFFAAGKTGTTSIEKALEEFADEIPFEYDKKIFDKHIPPEYAKAHLPKEIWDTYYKIAFVRNPWDWVISWYMFTWKTIYYPYREGFWNKPFYYYNIWKRKRGRFDTASFWLFWENMKRYRRGVESDNRYQHRFLTDANGNILVDFVGRFESLQQDFDQICESLNLPRRELTRENRGKFRSSQKLVDRPYQEYYTPEIVELVRDHYARDIREFGYSFDKNLRRVNNKKQNNVASNFVGIL